MAEWFEVYDSKRVLIRARRRATRLVWIFALISGALVAAAPVAVFVFPDVGVAVAGTCGIGLVLYGIWMIARLSQIHGKLWRIDLSVHRALGFDTGRRSRALAWPNVHQVDIDDSGLLLVGRTHGAWVRLQIPSTFPHYTALSHRVVEYAEAHDRPVWVDGKPWQSLDLEVLYPFLRSEREAA